MSIKVIFTDTTDSVPEQYWPAPAKFGLPSWYKDLMPYLDKKKKALTYYDSFTNATAKKCIPLFDAISAGYLIKTHCDISVSLDEYGQRIYQWPIDGALINFHNRRQIPEFPGITSDEPLPKFINPWSVRTPRGYSCLFVKPMSSDHSPINIIPGIVDTDRYFSAVNLPFVFDNSVEDIIIPAGTPIAQVIPFRRESFSMSLGSKKDIAEINSPLSITRSVFFNGYKNLFWSKKNYS